MKYYLLILFIVLNLNANNQLNNKIQSTKTKIIVDKKRALDYQSKIQELSQQVKQERTTLKKLTQDLNNLKAKASKNKVFKSEKLAEKDKLGQMRQKIFNQKQAVERKLVELISKDIAFSDIVRQEQKLSDSNYVINNEVFMIVKDIFSKESKDLKKDFIKYQTQINVIDKEINAISNQLAALDQRAKNILILKQKSKQSYEKMSAKLKDYNTYLKLILKSQQQMRSTLTNLLRTKEDQAKTNKPKPTAPSLPKLVQNTKQVTPSSNVNVLIDTSKVKIKQYASSYKAIRTTTYKGKKVKPPLQNYVIVKTFGTYLDPIYNIKIHNDSVTFKSKNPNAIVKNVMAGKIIFAKDVSLLGKTIIIKHRGNLHTIYSKLSRIAPNITKGKYIQSYTPIGRIDRELQFEVTKNNKPINPLSLLNT